MSVDCEGKEIFKADVAKQVAERMRRRGKSVTAYKCRTCGEWHVATVLTKTMKHVRKFRKVRKL